MHGAVKVAGFPVQFSESPCAIQSHAPEPGEHTQEILSRLVGLSPAEIEELLRDKVAASSKPTLETKAADSS